MKMNQNKFTFFVYSLFIDIDYNFELQEKFSTINEIFNTIIT